MTRTIAYKARRLIDCVAPEAIPDATILIEGQTISAVGQDLELPLGVMVEDLGDATILPGLIDCHAHLALCGSYDWYDVYARESAAMTAFRAARHAVQTLQCGVTTVRDVGGGVVIALREAIRTELIDGPRIVATGIPITMTGGHGLYLSRVADGISEVRKAAREQRLAGADWLKLFASGGILPEHLEPGAPQMSVEELRAATEEFHNGGRKVAAHAVSARSIENALEAGVDSIEHGQFLDEALAACMADTGAYLVPTLFGFHNIAQHGPSVGLSAKTVDGAKKISDAGMRSIQIAMKAGVRMATGSEAGAFLSPHNSHILAKELELRVAAGQSPMQALRVATQGGASLLGMAEHLGSLEAGKLADIVAVRGDPLQDIRVMKDVCLVVKGGIEVHRVREAPGQ